MGTLVIVGGVLMIVAFCVPWWGIKITKPSSARLGSRMQTVTRELMEFMQEAGKRSDWYERYRNVEYDNGFSRRMLTMQPGEKVTVYVWGWHTVPGILALAFGIVIVATMAVMTMVPPVARYSWIGSAGSAVLGIPIFILGLIWWITAPSADVDPVISQYVIAGPLICVLAGIGVLGLGLTGFVQGLLAFLRTSPPPPAPTPPGTWPRGPY